MTLLIDAAEYGGDLTYEALVTEILAGFVRHFDPSASAPGLRSATA